MRQNSGAALSTPAAGAPVVARARVPSSTYRLQLHRGFTFRDARDLLEYFGDLGVGDCYLSPVLEARPGSMHGYDVVNPARLNPELGTEDDFVDLARRCADREIGIVMDVVPNHLCIDPNLNRYFYDVLENGPSSPFARYFDIDWDPPKGDLAAKVLLPILGEQYGRALENKQIQVYLEGGAFFACCYGSVRLPLAPRSLTQILEPPLKSLQQTLGELHPHILELESILTALKHLPPRTETERAKVRERQREKEIVRRRLAALCDESADVRRAIEESILDLNGQLESPRSFDRLEALLSDQGYRLSYWSVASDEINYRRFFDINHLAAIRVEEPAVFSAVHEVALRFVRQGLVAGLRIDHIDGLLDPLKYLLDLGRSCRSALLLARQKAQAGAGGEDAARGVEAAREAGRGTEIGSTGSVPVAGSGEQDRPFYIIVEKILTWDEALRPDWPVYGTTGYDFANLVNGVFVDEGQAAAVKGVYGRIIDNPESFAEVAYEAKKLILSVSMSSELNVLARRLDRISEQHRYTRDFTLRSLEEALAEFIACFPVYRTYIRKSDRAVAEGDRRHIEAAVLAAKARNPAVSASIFEFIGDLLLLRDPEGLDETERAERREFVLKLQQLTGPVMAKGVEDTAFYRYNPLASCNEVGSNPERLGVSIDEFHRRNAERLASFPSTLLATSTHDTKRGEDVRARINVLSEIPLDWERAVMRFRELNRVHAFDYDGHRRGPSANDEYLLYQTLVGTWPLVRPDPAGHRAYVERIQRYMQKATKEAKVHTSWVNPNSAYDEGIARFVERALDPAPNNAFHSEIDRFARSLMRAGLSNALAQVVLKIAVPGVPDFYQGTEVWEDTLVDPDNRRQVDFRHRATLLAELKRAGERDCAGLVERLFRTLEDGRLKMWVTHRGLSHRRAHREVYLEGEYVPLTASGEKSEHVIAFARVAADGRTVIAVTGRFFQRLGAASRLPVGSEAWGDTVLEIPEAVHAARFRDLLSGASVDVSRRGARVMSLADVFARLPVALLEGFGRER